MEPILKQKKELKLSLSSVVLEKHRKTILTEINRGVRNQSNIVSDFKWPTKTVWHHFTILRDYGLIKPEKRLPNWKKALRDNVAENREKLVGYVLTDKGKAVITDYGFD